MKPLPHHRQQPWRGKCGLDREAHMRDTLISRFVVLLLIWMLSLTPLFFM